MVAAVHRWGAARPYVRGAARGLSLGGEHAAMWLAAGLAGAGLAEGERRTAWLRSTALVAGAHAASMVLKRIVRRPRPELDDGRADDDSGGRARTAGRHGFPSSHAASSAAAAVAFGALAPRVPVAPLAAAVCLSRLVAGVHYPSDVAAGALLGAGAARLGRGWALGRGPGAPAGGTRVRGGGGHG
ncbi:phosphatase PAP2 family protein [Streptomyces sp. KK5PA1]|uniref:Phosphatase PAP2 family protein n=2 Tax=Actinacidiphila acididurans TaxID=2784346 RepID=A0ABS2TQ82_9ACTN|nr:phosphatase PAP2 family protein [Actinacidiphila acididurans]